MRNYPRADEVEFGYYEYAAQLLALEVMRRGLPVDWLNRSYFVTQHQGRAVGFWSTRTNLNSSVAVHSTSRKDITRMLLERAGVSVAAGRGFAADRRHSAVEYGEKLGYPTRIVEQHFTGGDAGRFLVVGGWCVAVAQKVPPVLTGDGRCTVEDLINERNALRAEKPHLRKRLMVIDETLVAELARKDLTLSSVPPAGASIVLDQTTNTSRGSETADITDDVHPSFADVAVRAAAAVPGLRLAGVDVLARDLTAPASSGNHIVLEINSRPGIRSHHFPDRGRPRDVAKLIVDEVLEAGDEPRPVPAEVPAVRRSPRFPLSRLGVSLFARRGWA